MRRSELHLATLAMHEARDFVGIRETEGPNRGPAVEWFQKLGAIQPGLAWCAAFVNACAEVAAAKKNVRSPLEAVPLQGYVQSYWEWADDAGLLVPAADVGVGELFLLWYDWLDDGAGRWGHIGFVVSPPADGEGTFSTVEGNTNEEAAREGIGVFERTRSAAGDPPVAFVDWTRNIRGGRDA